MVNLPSSASLRVSSSTRKCSRRRSAPTAPSSRTCCTASASLARSGLPVVGRPTRRLRTFVLFAMLLLGPGKFAGRLFAEWPLFSGLTISKSSGKRRSKMRLKVPAWAHSAQNRRSQTLFKRMIGFPLSAFKKNKVRGCDSATTNMINKITEISEKLQLPSTDYNVAVIRELRSRLAKGSRPSLEGWVLDEKKAYRQIPTHPSRRKFSVICLKEPADGKVKFFVMVGHSFGLVSAVYNYNRRSAAINDILVNLFFLVAFNFYDDKYGFEPSHSCVLAHDVAQKIHWWLGAAFDVKKLQRSKKPDVLGVTYNLEEFKLEIQQKRRAELKETIEDILQKESLDPGSAGKLMFGASQLWGKVGRAFLRSLSERQYLKHARDDGFALNPALLLSLFQWLKLVQDGPPRPIEEQKLKKSDAVLFTDGFTPDARKNGKGLDRIGGVVFDRQQSKPYQFTAAVPERVKKFWLVRKTQIVPIEMLAPIVALSTFGPMIRGKDIIRALH